MYHIEIKGSAALVKDDWLIFQHNLLTVHGCTSYTQSVYYRDNLCPVMYVQNADTFELVMKKGADPTEFKVLFTGFKEADADAF